ncbi:hypothetical protein PAMC26510_15660 [Caballeronia sordidicola]|uniref:Uncharacterized protein n=1 Tax=Caballeronia sordidicola TaxID=196367 RepID=A0A242MU87_CABSO|nr:hypothetical protein PAMC26510_15660 [Caballeronia sordidicola]
MKVTKRDIWRAVATFWWFQAFLGAREREKPVPTAQAVLRAPAGVQRKSAA